ncbi:MAG: dihydropteroate synthase [Coriobacteriales bacterium]|nr:dihydropteroate synthase [Coriobacteriales bacterium]
MVACPASSGYHLPDANSRGGLVSGQRVWRCGRYELVLDVPLVMGIVNVTPDSFSDGGEHFEPHDAVTHALSLIDEGASIIDVGGESTRPGSEEVASAEELARVRPVVARLAEEPIPVSIDTRHPDVARAALEVGASIINDVSGFRDPQMVNVAAESDAGVVVMHMLGDPRTMQEAPHYRDVVAEVAEFLVLGATVLEAAGVAHDRIALDPGIGFGKTLEHNVTLLNALPEFVKLGYCVVVGASRKRFIGALTDAEDPRQRRGGSVAAAVWAAQRGADVVRAHDVADTVQALQVTAALQG